jgi:hypothetical protein
MWKMKSKTAKRAVAFPTTVKVGYRDYTIIDWSPNHARANGDYGRTSHMTREIQVDRSHGDRESAETLLHEIAHAVFSVYQIHDDDKEERTVAVISMGLAGVWRDNPDVMVWIGYHLEHGAQDAE